MNKEENEEKLYVKETTYHFNFNIERVWLIVKNFQYVLFLNNWKNFVPINIKGKDTFELGNEFYGKLFSELPFQAKVIKNISIPHFKHISWNITYFFQNKNYITKITEKLYKVTDSDTCVFVLKFKGSEEFHEIMKKIKPEDLTFENIVNKINELLSNSVIDLVQYEGGVISGKMEDIWEFVLNTIKLKKIAPLIDHDGDFDFSEMKEGDEAKIFYNHNKYVYVKCRLKEKRDNWNKWLIIFNIKSGYPKIPEHDYIIELTKINNKDCQLVILSKYNEPETNENIQIISQKKKYIINSIKDYLENYKFE